MSKKPIPSEQTGVFLPGNSTAELRSYPLPNPGIRQLLLEVGASGICGSDIGYIFNGYKTHKGLDGTPAYRGVIAGHEPCGKVVARGSDAKKFAIGDRVIVYHIVGCGECRNCRSGYFISCSNHNQRESYGWQRDGGHARFILVEEATCIELPDKLSYVDGSLIACGFGTAYEGLVRAKVDGSDSILVVGLGPLGLAVAIIARALGAKQIIGVERSTERLEFAQSLMIFDNVVLSDRNTLKTVFDLTAGHGCDVTVDCSGSLGGRSIAIDCAAEWGQISLLGEGGRLETEVSDSLLHKHLTIQASWVTSLQGMEDLANLLSEKNIHPEVIVSHRFMLADADEAYRLAAHGASGKVVLLPNS
jgi:threonine dehydrogenase-like Zn-dependent dehydrogenase